MTTIDNREKLIIINIGLQVEAVPEIVLNFSVFKNVSIMKWKNRILIKKEKKPC